MEQNISPRPPGAVFGDAFLYESLILNRQDANRYIVTQLTELDQNRFRSCPNPECGAIYSPQPDSVGRFCTACNTELGVQAPVLWLTETVAPFSETVRKVAQMGLEHGSIRPPLAAFEELVAGTLRYCLVSPQVEPFSGFIELSQLLKLGVFLSQGLEYLHINGITFEGKITDEAFAMDGGRIVWANFEQCAIFEMIPENFRQADTYTLATRMYYWLTGREDFTRDANLPETINELFEHALKSPGYSTALELSDAFDSAEKRLAAMVNVDFRIGRRTDVGMVRSLNEDSLAVLETTRILQSQSRPLGVFAIADGMGGHAAGEVASGIIVNTIMQEALASLFKVSDGDWPDQRFSDWLSQTIECANQAVLNYRKSAGTDMGSTLVLAVIKENRVHVAHVGDSRAYIIQVQGIRQITTDHSLVERLIATNQIKREEARYHPQRNVIYRTVGDKPAVEVEVSHHVLHPGDSLLLCSDGLSGMLDDRQIWKIVSEAPSPQAGCDALIAAANQAGGEDNISAILVKIAQV